MELKIMFIKFNFQKEANNSKSYNSKVIFHYGLPKLQLLLSVEQLLKEKWFMLLRIFLLRLVMI